MPNQNSSSRVDLSNTKPYTVIYSESHVYGSHAVNHVTVHRIRTNNLGEALRQRFNSNALFVFEGHAALEGEDPKNVVIATEILIYDGGEE